jgi:transcription elongation GreA/GreB family factor
VQQEQTKTALVNACLEKITEREKVIQSKLASLQEALEGESKSSAGDKFETGRAMLHNELDKQKSLTLELVKMRRILNDINSSEHSKTVALGSLVKTEAQQFFMSVGLGKITAEVSNNYWICISPASPLGQQLMDQVEDYEFSLNGKTFKIIEIT